MFKFFEPEDEYKTEKRRKYNLNTKINLIFFLIAFFSCLIFAVQKDFIRFFEKNDFKEFCFNNNTYSSEDLIEYQYLKAEKALNDHLLNFKDLDGYLNSEIVFNVKQTPEIHLYIDKSSLDKKRLPESICGYKLIIKNE